MIQAVLITLLLAGGSAAAAYLGRHLMEKLTKPKLGRWVYPVRENMDKEWNPWNIVVGDPALTSPDGARRLRYLGLTEISRGGPLCGECFLDTEKGSVRIGNACGCPPVWSSCGRYAALPLWTPEYEQHLGVLDAETWRLHVSKQRYSLLYLRSFADGFVIGVDNPGRGGHKLCARMDTTPWEMTLELGKNRPDVEKVVDETANRV